MGKMSQTKKHNHSMKTIMNSYQLALKFQNSHLWYGFRQWLWVVPAWKLNEDLKEQKIENKDERERERERERWQRDWIGF